MRFAHSLMLCAVVLPCALGAQASGTRRPAPRPAPGQPAPAPAPAVTQSMSAGKAKSTETNTSLGLKLGTLGIGGEIARLVSPHLGLRATVNWATGSYSRYDDEGVTWSYQPDNVSYAALLDIYPAQRGSFRLTLGATSNPMKGKAVGRIDVDPYYIYADSFINPRSQFGELVGRGTYGDVLPYVGIGVGSPASSRHGFGFVMDIGAAIGKPTVTASSTSGAAATDARVRAALAGRQAEWQDTADHVPVYPVVSMGISYRF